MDVAWEYAFEHHDCIPSSIPLIFPIMPVSFSYCIVYVMGQFPALTDVHSTKLQPICPLKYCMPLITGGVTVKTSQKNC